MTAMSSEPTSPQLDCKAGGVGITGNEKMYPPLQRLLTGRESTLLDLSSIFDRLNASDRAIFLGHVSYWVVNLRLSGHDATCY
jgi:hypothetical protein